MKIYLQNLSRQQLKKEARKAFGAKKGQKVGAITSSRTVNGKKQWRIIVNKDLSKQNYKRLLRHEEGHVFQEKTKIASKLKPDLKRYLIKQSTLKGYTPRQKLEETLSELYRAHKYDKSSRLYKNRHGRIV